MTTKNEYLQQANAILKEIGASVSLSYLWHGKHFIDDKEHRDVYQFTITKNRRFYTGRFGQSIANSGTGRHIRPTAYDILTCITKYNPGTFEDFCAEYGYDTDSRKAEKIYKEVVNEWEGINAVFTSEDLEKLQEIQ